MQLRLYKNSILSAEYDQVFIDRAQLLIYLNKLSYTDYEISNSYCEMQGSFIIPNSSTLLEINSYNYLRLTMNSASSYVADYMFAFITSTELKNNCTVIHYTLDTWATFFDSVTFDYGHMIRNKSLYEAGKVIGYYDKLKTTSDTFTLDVPDTITDSYAAVISVRFYTLTSAGETSQSTYLYGIVETTDKSASWDYATIYDRLGTLINYQTEASATISWGTFSMSDMHVDVDKIYIFPYDMITFNNTGLSQVAKITWNSYTILLMSSIESWEFYEEINLSGTDYTERATQLKMLGFGVYNNYFPLPTIINGDNNLYKALALNIHQFAISVNVNGKHYDMTSQFEINWPYESINSDTNKLREIALEIVSSQSSSSIVSGTMSSLTGLATAGLGTMAYIGSGGTNPFAGAMAFSGVNSLISGISGVVNASNVADLKSAEAYSSTYLNTSSAQRNDFNCILGMGIVKLSPKSGSTEETYINAQIENIKYVGYKTDIIVTSLPTSSAPTVSSDGYDYIKFDSVTLHGLPAQYLNVIKQVLLQGVRIWYWANKL